MLGNGHKTLKTWRWQNDDGPMKYQLSWLWGDIWHGGQIGAGLRSSETERENHWDRTLSSICVAAAALTISTVTVETGTGDDHMDPPASLSSPTHQDPPTQVSLLTQTTLHTHFYTHLHIRYTSVIILTHYITVTHKHNVASHPRMCVVDGELV